MHSTMKRHALKILDAAVDSVRPDRIFERPDVKELIEKAGRDARRVNVLGFGKAAAAMAVALEEILSRPIDDGAVIIPQNYLADLPASLRPATISLLPGGHPHPTEASIESARKLMNMARGATEDDVVIVLISGGGSALFADFAEGISLDDAARLNEILLASGASIDEVNSIRKQISVVSGGRLAKTVHPARCISFAISDVPGDDPSIIASGPTVPDEAGFQDALHVLESRDLLGKVPDSIRAFFSNGESETAATVRSGDAHLGKADYHVLATNRVALEAAAQRAEYLGYHVIDIRNLWGEAAGAGRHIAAELNAIDMNRKACLLYGGETTVTLPPDHGKGGRNQELALAAAQQLADAKTPSVILSAGTDGIDGPTDAAGGIVDQKTMRHAAEIGIGLSAALAEHAAYDALKALDAHVMIGPTHTNVMDIVIALRNP